MKVFDITHGFNEIETYDIRRHELAGIVDTFVIVEGLYTFTGKERTPRFENIPGVTHVTLSIQHTNAWESERLHRDSVPLDTIGDNDIVIYGDLDEIPKAEAVRTAIKHITAGEYSVVKIELFTFYLYYNTRMPGEIVTATVTTGAYIKTHKPFTVRKAIPDYTITGFNGWHFTSCGGVDRVKEKLVAWSHTEYAHLAENITQFYDPPRRPFCNTLLIVDPVDVMPEYIKVNRHMFKKQGLMR